jgi:hypothetical protein
MKFWQKKFLRPNSITVSLISEAQFLCESLHRVVDKSLFKGTVSRDFLHLVFFMNQFPPSPRVFHLDRFDCFRKFAEIFASQCAPPVSTTPVANISTIFASVVDTGGKLPPVSTTPVANNGNNIRLQTP